MYRLAWVSLQGCPESSVRAAFHYVRTGDIVRPDNLPDSDELAALLDREPQSGERQTLSA